MGNGTGERRVGRRDEGRAPVEARDQARPREVRHVEDHEATVPVAHVEPVVEPDGMVTAVLAAGPGRRLAAPRPLPRHPPAAHLLRPCGIGEVEDHHDVADVAVQLGRDVGVAPVEGEAVDAQASAMPEGQLAGAARIGDVEDEEPAGAARGGRAVPLAVDEHEPVARAHLVRMRPRRHLQGSDPARRGGIAHVHERGAVRRFHVRDAREGAVDHHLPAARAVEVRDLPEAARARAIA